MAILLTALQLILAALSIYAAYRTVRSEHAAEGYARDLLASKGRLIANESAIAAMHDKHIALSGRVNALRRWTKPEEQLEFVNLGRPNHAPAELDPELAAELALQNAKPVQPGGV